MNDTTSNKTDYRDYGLWERAVLKQWPDAKIGGRPRSHKTFAFLGRSVLGHFDPQNNTGFVYRVGQYRG